MNQDISPIFIFSLPRSGSTLLQRILASHPQIATVSEPWFILPFLYSTRERGWYSEYGHSSVVAAINDFVEQLPQGQTDWDLELAALIIRLYRKASPPEATHFLDKTPRYHLVAEDIIKMFPNGRFIFLWRNPLALVSSIIETWGKGRWNIHESKVDLFTGFRSLVAAHKANAHNSIALRYEDLVADPVTQIQSIMAYLGFPGDSVDVSQFSAVSLQGRMGDPEGTKKYQEINTQPLTKWHKSLRSPVRKWWCKRYLNWLGEEDLAHTGYSLEELTDALAAAPSSLSTSASDIMRMSYGLTYHLLEPRIVKHKALGARNWAHTHIHT